MSFPDFGASGDEFRGISVRRARHAKTNAACFGEKQRGRFQTRAGSQKHGSVAPVWRKRHQLRLFMCLLTATVEEMPSFPYVIWRQWRPCMSANRTQSLVLTAIIGAFLAASQTPEAALQGIGSGNAMAQAQPAGQKPRDSRPQNQPQNLFEALFPNLLQDRLRREKAALDAQRKSDGTAAPKISAPQYYTYKPDRMVRIELASLVPAASSAATGAAIVETVGSVIAPVAAAAPASSGREAFDTVAARFGSIAVMAEPEIAEAVVEHYRKNPSLLWLGADLMPNAQANSVMLILAEAGKYGLVAEDYSVTPPELPADASAEQKIDAAARFEVALTARAVRYALDASGGAIDPNRISGYHDLPKKSLTASAALQQITTGIPGLALISFHPANDKYRSLLVELARLQGEEDEGIVIPDGTLIKPGERNAALPLVIEAIGKRASAELKAQFSNVLLPATPAAPAELPAANPPATPEMAAATPSPTEPVPAAVPVSAGLAAKVEGGTITVPATSGTAESSPATVVDSAAAPAPASIDPDLYTPEKVELVKAFQREAGLGADGIVGRNTISRLTGSSVESKRQRVVIALEQLRWHPADFGNRYVFINQPEYIARYVEDGKTKLDMRVVVGTKANQTSFFYDEIETVEYNPYWGVPQSILVNEFLPKLRANPAYLDERGYEVTDGRGNRIPSSAIDWWAYGSSIPYDVRQSPGEANALGELKILFPNKHAIYMHDTPARDLFQRDMRAFSHGCVRLAEPRAMAAAVLGKPVSHVEEMLGKGHGQDEIANPFPVYVAYFTAWPQEDGSIGYFADVYGRDEAVMKAFAAVRVERGAAG
jgi:murein L,D-transpeptidase YcbB/YkuD